MAGQEEARQGGFLLPPGVGLPTFLVGLGEERERERGKGKGGAAPLLFQFGLEGEGARGLPWPPLLFSTKAHLGPLNPRGVPVTPRYFGIYPITPGTIPVSEYSNPIYQSLCPDHSDTTCNVRDHIRDSEITSVHQNV